MIETIVNFLLVFFLGAGSVVAALFFFVKLILDAQENSNE